MNKIEQLDERIRDLQNQLREANEALRKEWDEKAKEYVGKNVVVTWNQREATFATIKDAYYENGELYLVTNKYIYIEGTSISTSTDSEIYLGDDDYESFITVDEDPLDLAMQFIRTNIKRELNEG